MNISRMVLNCVSLLLIGLSFGGLSTAAYAQGTVTHLSGTLSVQKPDGTVKILSQKSEVVAGDVLATEKDSYAQIDFTDGSQATLRPNTRLKIEAYQFRKEEPQADNLVFRLLKGGLRTLTGLVGKRGNQDAYRINTATATIGIRGSVGDTLACPCPGTTAVSDKLPDGVFHKTADGTYIITNPAGSVEVGAGQVGFAPPEPGKPPVVLPDPPPLGVEFDPKDKFKRQVGADRDAECRT